MTEVKTAPVAPDRLFADWLHEFGEALESRNAACIADHFEPDGYWRDILAFAWDYRTHSGVSEIVAALSDRLGEVRPEVVRPAQNRIPPREVKRSGRVVVEAYFDFDTAVGSGTGFVRLVPSQDGPKIWLLLTTLQELDGREEKVGPDRPDGLETAHDFAGPNWLDRREEERAFVGREPEVLIVGAGQAGLSLAARLRQMGADALVVERTTRIGDVWRNRYHALTLHNEVWANSMPYLPFPDTWPTFLPKDKLAGWLESYAEAMELNVWAATEFVGGTYDAEENRWTVTLRGANGKETVFHPRHLVLASGGVSGLPNVPQLAESERFAGRIIHSSEFASGKDFAGQKAIVVGTGNSGHDVAQDLHSNGATAVSIVQRNPTCVVSLVPSGTMVYSLYSEHANIEAIDLITAAVPYEVLRETYQWITKRTCELDRDLLTRLDRVGFDTDFEPDNTGFHMRYLRSGGGYYINVGCSDLIADGSVGLLKSRDIEGFEANGMRLSNGDVVEADVVVLATGYENQQEMVRRLLGDEIADAVGPIWGLDENHELRNMWRRTAQPGFWVMGGNLLECRMYSRFLALQIVADLDGLTRHE